MKRFFFVYLSIFLFYPVIIFAQDAGHMDNKKKWENMNPQQRYEMQKRYREWKSLPSEKQKKLKRNFKTYNELTPADKKRLKDKVCHLDNEILEKVDKALLISLELNT